MADKNTGSAGTVRVVAWESNTSAAGNWSDVSWQLWLIERVTSNSTRHLTPNIPANVQVAGVGTVWSGAFGFDWQPSGLQSTLIASGTTRVYHAADGTGSTTVTGYIGDTATSGAGGPTSVGQGVGLTTLKVVPGTPTGVTATRVSDTQVNVEWAQSSASNGQPTTNTIRRKVNDAAWENAVTISATTAAAIAAAANQQIVYGVKGSNTAGDSGWSADSAPAYTTPAAPTGVTAAKDASLDIVVSFTPHVGFSAHEHVVVHGTVSGGVTTWDGSPLVALAAGTVSYTHVDPDPADVHVYKVYARNTDTAALTSSAVVSNSVQLLVAPNKPTLPVIGPFADKGAAFPFTWTHNAVDTTAQSAYEVGYSTNGGGAWSSTGKVTSATASKTFAADTYTSGQQLTLRVRTWGQAASGGSDGTGASPWSDQATVTFKTRPVVTIVGPVDAGVYEQSALAVLLGFSQVEGATFVSATIGLHQGATLIEQRTSTTLASTLLTTRVANGETYTVKVTVRDSNGLVSNLASATFDVVYTEPVAAIVTLTYLEDSGIGQVGLSIPSPGAGEAAAVAVTVTRSIGGEVETVVEQYPAASSLAILDMTATIHGDNIYTVTTVSADGATTEVVETLTTTEDEWAFMSTGAGFTQIIRFGGDLKPQAKPSVDSALVKTSGRKRPIGLYGTTGDLVVSGTGEVVTGLGSSAEDIEAFLLVPGKGCYRDPTGRRMFGTISGQVSRDTFLIGSFTYSIRETS